jgi:hypothetical protein
MFRRRDIKTQPSKLPSCDVNVGQRSFLVNWCVVKSIRLHIWSSSSRAKMSLLLNLQMDQKRQHDQGETKQHLLKGWDGLVVLASISWIPSHNSGARFSQVTGHSNRFRITLLRPTISSPECHHHGARCTALAHTGLAQVIFSRPGFVPLHGGPLAESWTRSRNVSPPSLPYALNFARLKGHLRTSVTRQVSSLTRTKA